MLHKSQFPIQIQICLLHSQHNQLHCQVKSGWQVRNISLALGLYEILGKVFWIRINNACQAPFSLSTLPLPWTHPNVNSFFHVSILEDAFVLFKLRLAVLQPEAWDSCMNSLMDVETSNICLRKSSVSPRISTKLSVEAQQIYSQNWLPSSSLEQPQPWSKTRMQQCRFFIFSATTKCFPSRHATAYRSVFHLIRLINSVICDWVESSTAQHNNSQHATARLRTAISICAINFNFKRACSENISPLPPASCLRLLNRKIESHDERSLFSSFLQQDNSLSS